MSALTCACGCSQWFCQCNAGGVIIERKCLNCQEYEPTTARMAAECNERGRLEKLINHLRNTTFYEDPASVYYHCNYKGGLFEHSNNVLNNLRRLTADLRLQWQDPESPMIVALCHDLCKVGAHLPDGKGGYVKNPDRPKGHGDLSVLRAKEIIVLTEEEELCIRWHMGAYDIKENWNAYNEALRRYPNVFWTHNADMMATHFDEIKVVVK